MGMTDPDVLIDAIATTLRSNADLMALLNNDAANVIARHLDYEAGIANLEGEEIEQPLQTVLVGWLGTRTGNFGKMDTIKHDFVLSIKPKGQVATMFTTIREGVCTVPATRKFKLLCVHSSVRPPEDMSCVPAGVFVAQGYGLYDSGIIKFTLVERGVDD